VSFEVVSLFILGKHGFASCDLALDALVQPSGNPSAIVFEVEIDLQLHRLHSL
jgi:hypothetical protein